VPEVSHSKFMAQFGDFHLRVEWANQRLNWLMGSELSSTMLLEDWVPSRRLPRVPGLEVRRGRLIIGP
jgi:hypothetical protein